MLPWGLGHVCELNGTLDPMNGHNLIMCHVCKCYWFRLVVVVLKTPNFAHHDPYSCACGLGLSTATHI